MRHFIVLISSFFVFISCQYQNPNDPQAIVDRAIETAGGTKFLASTIAFDFRDRHYIAKRKDGLYSYQRIFIDSTNTVFHDFLTNDGFVRKINDEIAMVPDTMKAKYARSTNSVLYFALLPYGLNDAAVKKEYIGETTLEGQLYNKIKITFSSSGGGEDHEDIFVYWIHQQNYTVDYFGYSYNTDGGGIRFRKAVHTHNVEGIQLQDYINYRPTDETISVDQLDSLFLAGKLIELSKIELKNISVQVGAPDDL